MTKISIHALRVEGDQLELFVEARLQRFLSTPSGWRATSFLLHLLHGVRISIHALRVEGDCPDRASGCRSQCISIHALRVEGDV